MNRRNFIKLSALTAISLNPVARMVGGVTLGSQLAIASTNLTGYKALVILFLDGGNDAMNMFPPTEASAHAQYKAVRYNTEAPIYGSMDIEIDDLSNTNFTLDANGHYIKNQGTNHPYYDAPQSGDGKSDSAMRSYKMGTYHTTETTNNGDGTYTPTTTKTGLGINSMMPELAAMYKSGKVSLISNVGTLTKPILKADTTDESNLPIFLFAHNHQQRAVYTAQAEQLGDTGWAGRIADAWDVNAPVGLNLSYDGMKRMLIGETTSPLVMPTGTPVSFRTRYNDFRTRGDGFESLLNRFDAIEKSNAFSTYYGHKTKLAGDLSTRLLTAMEEAPDFSIFTAKNTYGQELFNPEVSMENDVALEMHDEIRDNIFKQFGAAAKMIKVGKDTLGHSRQIIFVRLPGFDSHSQQAVNHANNLRSVSIATSDFQKALEEMGLDEQVLTVSLSEFGRTLKNNSDGTDHGWGGHSFMMTGDNTFNGGNVFGTVMDDLRLDGVNTYTEKGRIIPTTSIEQMLAPALKWFGVDDALMETVLPNLVNFRTDSTDAESAFLQGVFS